MFNELSGIYNKSTIYRNDEFKKYTYLSLYVIMNKRGKSVELNAKEGVEIKNAILDAIKYLENYGIESLPLMFNGIEICVHSNSDCYELIKKYFDDFKEFKKSLNSSFI